MWRAMPSKTVWLFFLLQVSRHHASDDVAMGYVCHGLYHMVHHAYAMPSKRRPKSWPSLLVCRDGSVPHTDLVSSQQTRNGHTVLLLEQLLLEACGGWRHA